MLGGDILLRIRFRYPVGSTFYSMLDKKEEYASGVEELDPNNSDYEGIIVEISEEAASE